jgi:tetratricopeptide (TPR) repeat protein
MAKGAYSEAIDRYTEVLAIRPDEASTLAARANAYEGLGDFQSAISDLGRAIELDFNAPAQHLWERGRLRKRVGDTRGALDDFSDVIRLWEGRNDPFFFPNRYLERGALWETVGDWGKAITDYEASIAAGLLRSLSQAALARLLANRPDRKYQDIGRAIALAREACDGTKWKSDRCLVALADACAASGDRANAIVYMKQAIALADESNAEGYRATLHRYEAGQT